MIIRPMDLRVTRYGGSTPLNKKGGTIIFHGDLLPA